MTDPYKVLGVSPNATDDEVKDAYRRLARKYHPDNYVNNPLSDLATEKMKEINEAYDEIQRQRKSGGSGYGQQSYGGGYQQSYGGYQRNYGGYQQSYGGSSQFADIRRLINLNRLETALQGGIFFDVLAVLIQRCGTDAVQFASCQHRFQHVSGIHRAVGLSGADDQVQLIDEQNFRRSF